MPKEKTDPFTALAEQLIRDAEAVPVLLNHAEAFRGSAETNKT
jgi:hypothetical protein